MRQKSGTRESSSERLVKNIRRVTRKQYSSEEKIRIVLDGLRGEFSIAELCRREGIAESLYYSWSKEFLEAGWPARCFVPVGMRVYITGDTGDRDTDGCGIARL